MTADPLPAEIARSRLLTAAEFHRLADLLPEVERFANLANPSTRRAYGNAVGDFMRGAMFRPVCNNDTGRLERAITRDGINELVGAYSAQLEFAVGAHALQARAATNALDHEADIAKVQE